MNTFFTSDSHFGHANIIRFQDRPFRSVGHMNEVLIHRWNSVVGPDDIVYHLGDLAMGPFEETVTLTARLQGRRYLVPGNHDRVSSLNKPARREAAAEIYRAAGWTILPEEFEIVIDERPVLLSHYPYQGDHTENDRHVNLRPVDRGLPLIHGHIHDLRGTEGRMFNASVERHDYTPVHIDTIRDWLKGV